MQAADVPLEGPGGRESPLEQIRHPTDKHGCLNGFDDEPWRGCILTSRTADPNTQREWPPRIEFGFGCSTTSLRDHRSCARTGRSRSPTPTEQRGEKVHVSVIGRNSDRLQGAATEGG